MRLALQTLAVVAVLMPTWAIPVFESESVEAAETEAPASEPLPSPESACIVNSQGTTDWRRCSQGMLALLPADRGPRMAAASRGTPASPRGHLLPNGLNAPLRC